MYLLEESAATILGTESELMTFICFVVPSEISIAWTVSSVFKLLLALTVFESD